MHFENNPGLLLWPGLTWLQKTSITSQKVSQQ